MVSWRARAECFADFAVGAKELLIHGNQFPSQRGPVGFCCVRTWIARVMGAGVNRAF